MGVVAYDETRVTLVTHPLAQHKLALLRSEDTPSARFRSLVGDLSAMLALEALADLPLKDVSVTTPLETCTCKRIAGKAPVVVPILRAGLGMVDSILELMPWALVGHVGMQRDETTHRPAQYLCKLPPAIEERTCLIVDPMLATGGTLVAAVEVLREAGAKDVRALTIVSAPDGLAAVLQADPAVRLFTCAVDRCLDENAYIRPGLGDAGDRIFGTL